MKVYAKCSDCFHNDGLGSLLLLLLMMLLRGGEVVTEGADVMTVLVVEAGVFAASDSDLRESLARRSFFSFAFSRPARQNSSNLELMSSSDLLAAPAVD